jgi:hypothetical protein
VTDQNPKVVPLRKRAENTLIDSLHDAIENFDAARDWSIEGMIEGDPIVLVIGPEKSGKSWLLQELAVSTILGDSSLGRFAVRRPGPVVYLDAEYGDRECARRIIRLARAHGHEARELADDLDYAYARGWTIEYTPSDDPEPGERKKKSDGNDSLTKRLARELGAMRKAGDGPAMIIIDPLRNFLRGSENDADAVLKFFLGLEILRNKAQCPIVVAHHLNKSGGYSGSRALLGRADLIIEGSDEPEPWFSAIGRTIRRGDAIAERFTVTIDHTDDDDDTKARTLVRARFASENRSKSDLGKTSHRVLGVVKEHEPVSQSQVAKLAKIANGMAGDCLRELEQLGCVRREKGKWETSIGETFSP